jgi:hypothetical protein
MDEQKPGLNSVLAKTRPTAKACAYALDLQNMTHRMVVNMRHHSGQVAITAQN